jgi:dTDP-4-amino-4,6-dideoxygalactose transaminase
MIKVTNVKEQAQDLYSEIQTRWKKIIETGDFILGQEVNDFESWMSVRCGTAHAISMNSGTDALVVAMRALGIGPGDEVITCANTFIATVGAIISVGATPVLADVGRDELINAISISKIITTKTKAVIPVHLRGRPVDMRPILEICKHFGIFIIEDCAQAIGTSINGKQVGTDGIASAFSLHPLKTLGGFGDGGILITQDEHIATYAQLYVNHGLENRTSANFFGINSRLDSMQAAILNLKTRYLDSWLKRRNQIAHFYNAELKDTLSGIDLGESVPGNSYYHYVLATTYRKEFSAFLANAGIQTAIHYPIPIHQQTAWFARHKKVSLPMTEILSQRIVTIPCHHHLSDVHVEHITQTIKKFDKSLKRSKRNFPLQP